MFKNNLWTAEHIQYWANWFARADELDDYLDNKITLQEMAWICEDYENIG